MIQHIVYVPETESAAFVQYVEAKGYAHEPVETDTGNIPEWHKAILDERIANRGTATYISLEEFMEEMRKEDE